MAVPVLGQIAVADPTTNVLVGSLARARRANGVALVLVVFVTVDDVLLVVDWLAPWRIVGAFVCFGAIFVVAWRPRGFMRWSGPVLALLRAEAWRVVRARVVRANRWNAHIEVTEVTEVTEDDTVVTLAVGVPVSHRAVIVDRVWVVGPVGRWAVVRVPGSHRFFPGRVVEPVTARAVAAVDPTSAAVRLYWLMPLLAMVVVVVAVQVVAGYLDGPLPGALGGALGTATAILLLVAVSARRGMLSLPRLVRRAEWTRCAAVVEPWKVRWGAIVKATATVTLPDGSTRTVRMPHAPVDVLGTVCETSALWISTTTSGAAAVGFPGTPQITYGVVSAGWTGRR